jgi:serine/threonine protein kinase
MPEPLVHPEAGSLATRPPSSDAEPTDGADAAAGHDSRLTAFLAPPQAEGELGRLGGFRILGILGHGGMGVVFEGEDPKLGRKVAIKAMLPHLAGSQSARERFLREARAAAALEHDHIVAIHHVDEDRGAPFIVMPFLKGEPLDRRLARTQKLALGEVLRIGREISLALAAAHEAGLIHRDIKPANIWLETPQDRVKILDFGLARAATQSAALTQEGAIVGTPAYMAPEQARGEKVDGRCDLFSLGVVLYQLSTGKQPFQGSDPMSTLMAVVTTEPAPPAQLADVPPELSELVMGLLEKDPAQRVATAAEVVNALRSLEERQHATEMIAPRPLPRPAKQGTLESAPSTRMPAASTRPAAPARKSSLPVLLAVGVALLGVVVAGVLMFWPRPKDTGSTEPPSRAQGGGTGDQPRGSPLPKQYINGLGMEFVLVPKGKFWMGGGGGKVGDREVEISHDFYLGKYEVTQEEWHKVMGNNPSFFPRMKGLVKDDLRHLREDAKRFPVEMISYNDALTFMERLNERQQIAGWVYRLPKESEWEYACRGGPLPDKADYSFDFYLEAPTNTLPADSANFDKVRNRTCKVGSYAPNRLGLYDMHGNVSEWCEVDHRDGQGRVYRGGGWNSPAGLCRAGFRHHPPVPRHDALGLRVARVPVARTGR